MGDEPFGYLLIALAGVVVAAGVAGLTAVWLADPEDPASRRASRVPRRRVYDRLYQRLRRPQPTSRWARLIGGLGRTGKRVGPAILVVGVILTIALLKPKP